MHDIGKRTTGMAIAGIRFSNSSPEAAKTSAGPLLGRLGKLGLADLVEVAASPAHKPPRIDIRLKPAVSHRLTPGADTTRLCTALHLDTTNNRDDLEREILFSMMAGPIPFDFPSYAELESALHIRCNIVAAARSTELAFHTSATERPEAFWRYTPGCGFTLLPGASLIAALEAATQPGISGKQYAFSCYRATEYVILLGLTQELARCNPALLRQLEARWRIEPIMSGQFHDVFLREHGSMDEPLPWKYYVPGDRVWFRNPDEASAEATGYEGSWVIYLGNGLFSNFWHAGKPYSLTSKCVEIFHWRHAAFHDEAGELQMDEPKVEALVEATMRDPEKIETIMEKVARYRDSRGVFQDGGCIDTSREYVRCVRPGTTDLAFPVSK